MVYADYDYYLSEYMGTMGADDFLRLSRHASRWLDTLTMGRCTAQADDTRIKDACCAVAEAMLLNEKGEGISSETNDGVSVTYESSSAKRRQQRLYDAAAMYLAFTGLLYRG